MGWFSDVWDGVKDIAGSIGGIGGAAVGSVFGPAGAMLGYGIGSSLGNSVQSKNAYKTQLADQYKLIQYQNEYNAPVNQMARLQEAGLNPNLVYNNGSATVNSASGSIPNYNVPNPVSLAQYYNLNKQSELLDAQRDVAYWNAGIAQQNVNRANADARIARYNADYAEAEYKLFKKTGKIPETYQRSDWSGELTGLLKGIFGSNLTKN